VELRAAASARSPIRQVQEGWKRVGGTGEGLYMALFQVKDLAAAEARFRGQREVEVNETFRKLFR